MFEFVLPSVIASYFGLLILFFVLRKGISTSFDRQRLALFLSAPRLISPVE